MEFLYVIGEPGAGKSTLVKALAGDTEKRMSREPVPHIVWNTPTQQVLEIGYERDTFRGTDATPMSVQPAAIKFVQSRPCDLMMGEGDRLATSGFFTAIQEAGYRFILLHLDPPDAAQRRKRRAAELGNAQNATWVKGRVSKVKNLVRQWALEADSYVPIYESDLQRSVELVREASKVAATLGRSG